MSDRARRAAQRIERAWLADPLRRRLSDFARERSQPLYLVGGAPRDIVLGRPVGDWDLAGPGAAELARRWASDEDLRAVTLHEDLPTVRVIVRPGEPDGFLDFADLRAAAVEATSEGAFLMSIGGEHSITPALVEGVRATVGVGSVLHFDAHADLRDEYLGLRNSHACAARRIIEAGVPVVSVGVRSLSREEYQFAEKNGVPIHWAAALMKDSTGSWIEAVVEQLTDPVYISVDVDVFDPALLPETGTPEPGGLDWYRVTACLRRVIAERKVSAADIVEFSPSGNNPAGAFTVARLAVKILLYKEISRSEDR